MSKTDLVQGTRTRVEAMMKLHDAPCGDDDLFGDDALDVDDDEGHNKKDRKSKDTGKDRKEKKDRAKEKDAADPPAKKHKKENKERESSSTACGKGKQRSVVELPGAKPHKKPRKA